MDKFNFGYSTNNILIATEKQYKLKLLEKIKAITKIMRRNFFFYFEQNETHKNTKNIYYGLTSDKAPPPIKLLELFEEDSFKTVNSKINLTQI